MKLHNLILKRVNNYYQEYINIDYNIDTIINSYNNNENSTFLIPKLSNNFFLK